MNLPNIKLKMSLNFAQLQVEHNEWAKHNFDVVRPNREGAWKSVMGVMEELGELSHSLLKQNQGIRGSFEQHEEKAKDAVGDMVVFLADLCSNMGWNFQTIVETLLGTKLNNVIGKRIRFMAENRDIVVTTPRSQSAIKTGVGEFMQL